MNTGDQNPIATRVSESLFPVCLRAPNVCLSWFGGESGDKTCLQTIYAQNCSPDN